MLKINTFLLLILISFSFQDKNCLAKHKACAEPEEEEEEEEVELNCKVNNCVRCESAESTTCYYCKDGFAITSDEQSCKSFQHCIRLEEGDEKCKECEYLFHPNDEGQCEKTFCTGYNENICINCIDGYYLNAAKKCIKIPISECKQYDGKKCTECLDGDDPKEDGTCNQHEWIEGCTKYQNGKCIECNNEFYSPTPKNEKCEFKSCESGQKAYEFCLCQAGYELDDDDNICVGYDGSKDAPTSSSKNNKAEFAWIIFILALLI